MMEVEDIAIQILHRELPQSPRFSFQRVDDVRPKGYEFLVSGVEILSEYPLNGRFEGRLTPTKEDERI